MIKFIPETVYNSERAGIYGFFNAVANTLDKGMNKAIAEGLNKKFANDLCPSHPDFINEIVVDVSTKERFHIKSYCCISYLPVLQAIQKDEKPKLDLGFKLGESLRKQYKTFSKR